MTGRARLLAVDGSGVLTNRVFLDDPHLARLLDTLDRDGETARVVGGAVRNAALGLPPGDIDVTTTARPEIVTARAKSAHFRSIPTGLAHGTVTVVVAGSPFEVTTLREDVETDGRHAVVRFGRDYRLDALRRDFTMNALSVDADGRIHDYTHGLADLSAGRVRFIGDAETRIREDYLRILRFFRFSATYAAGALDADGLAASATEAEGLAHLSRERIRIEVLKLIAAPRAIEVIVAMDTLALLDRVIGKPCCPARFARVRAIEAARASLSDPLLGLAALALRTERDAMALRDSLRLSNEERDRLVRLAGCIAGPVVRPTPPDAHELSALLYGHGRQTALDAITLWQAESQAHPGDPAWLAAARFLSIAIIPNLPVSGADIVARGIRSGPMVGRVLKSLQALWIRAGFPDSPAILHDLLDQAILASRTETGGP